MSLCPVRRTFSDERGPGAFHTLGDLPKRRHSPSPRKPPVFHLSHDDNDDHSSSLDEQSPTSLQTIPFPRSPASPPPTDSRAPSPPPQLLRGASAPILLANGKPLKSSLKSSSSSPAMSTYPWSPHMHLRARSEPSTPAATPKNVHFPEKDYGLTTVCVFNCSARPAALSSPANGNGDETETEGEDTPLTRFPFPPLSSAFNYEVDPAKSSPIPCESSLAANLILESLHLFSSGQATKPFLTGSVLVCNLAFEKHVAIRFTLDDWQTVSEVGAHHIESLSCLPSQILSLPSHSTMEGTASQGGRGWDRFSFTIRLEDYVHSLSTRTLWLAVRYSTNSTYPEPGSIQYGPGGEWWDNNDGTNYRIGFRPALSAPTLSRSRPRRETVAAPMSTPRTQPQPATTSKEHALGHIVPSVPRTKEIQPASEREKRSIPLPMGRLSLCNYASPTVRTSPSTASPSVGSLQRLSPPSTINRDLSHSATLHSSSDEDTTSPASSTLSTPSVSPTITPRVIINGHPATPVYSRYSGENDRDTTTTPRSGHIFDWDWSAPDKLQIGGLSRQQAGLGPVSRLPERRGDIPSSLSRKAPAEDSHSLYDTLVTQWCFAQGPSLDQNNYGDSGIMA